MVRYIIAFMIFSFAGWVWESIYCTICRKKWANRGFLYGPICPIYGFGSVMGLAVYDCVLSGLIPELPWWVILPVGVVVSMLLEYPTSYILEKLFHARWWDYSKVPLNINGRVSLPTGVGFGLAAILLLKVLLPLFEGMYIKIPALISELLAFLSVGLISADITLTVSELTDFQRRVKKLDESFQNDMTENVYRLILMNRTLKQRAAGRIVEFRYGKRNSELAVKLQKEKFDELLTEYLKSSEVQQMTNSVKPGQTTLSEHCENVAWISFLINKKLHLNADEKKLIESAILHDFNLHDSDNIRNHMWALNTAEIPKNKESLILCIADKYCDIIETLRRKR